MLPDTFFLFGSTILFLGGIEPPIKVQVLDVQNDKCLTTISAKEEQSELVYSVAMVEISDI